MMLSDKEKEVDSVRKRGEEMNRDSAQSSERLASVEKLVAILSLSSVLVECFEVVLHL